ncbi:MAG TPA: bifunctional 4-hydroxy-2-oxoglutarate aldolase/2-dehydro-3-deoxy-phosphogluconate aldolase [bacterium]|nr:bifunctional 4-hydroxy-2-oxoglutarate aldolase/2-dehydro-3-deoxy-phosphogluconate aldolase [bacterium]HQG44335.1 bifunctional 4-hydroxy-2-oxoglutarate aldolase/2-dehydro-3-deoxy-phosphogluconate aldolase [bacterium]HQI49585.1 bifunctional 4-hydroxy-2-oxoglutarate aldolase/2-dehydro-3-deoxy-phosphogluconate aldolase [bacterium]HQJ65938.1 bifunctional 4-hydroxy-2-oxoglutarate aldolase/2-dehydro-3-deoxy-phosphogluconate aldolase [bacterium]
MQNKSQILYSKLREKRLIALLSPVRPEDCLAAWEALDPLGITLEIALRSPASAPGISLLLRMQPDALVLAGTVMTAAQSEQVIAMGVAGVVCPDYFPEVVERCGAADLMCIPGGISGVGAQLAQKAALYGCTIEELQELHPHQYIHKLFPAITGTVSFLGLAPAWKGPYKGLQMVYTGGITRANLSEVAGFDRSGIFCGSALTKAAPDQNAMRAEGEQWLALVQGAAQL